MQNQHNGVQNQGSGVDGFLESSSQMEVLSSDDVDEFAELHRPAWDLTFEQMSAGSFRAEKIIRRSENAVAYRERYGRTVRAQGTPAPGTFVVGAVKRGRAKGRWWGRSFPESALVTISDKSWADLILPEECDDIVAAFDKEQLRESVGILTGSEPRWMDCEGHFLEMEQRRCDWVAKEWIRLIEHPESDNSETLFDKLLQPLVSVLPQNAESVKRPSTRAALVRRAVEISDAALGHKSISQICLELRVSQRALNYAFRSQVGEPPVRYLRMRRMNQVRRQLRGAEPDEMTISSVATDFGFYDAGRFSVEYRKLFGESPSATLRRLPCRGPSQVRRGA